MLTTIGELRSRVESDCAGLVADLQHLTGRYGDDEARAWSRSLPSLSHMLRAPSFQPLHLYFGSRGNLALEYQLPAASSWCDVVLLGAHEGKASAVILELKDWLTRSDRPGRVEGLVERQGRQELHPSDQVRGYAEYCRRFHSAVADREARVNGCVLFTNDQWIGPYLVAPNDRIALEYPLFSMAADDVDSRLPAYFATRLTLPDESFAESFASGRYRQDRGFVAQIGAQILHPSSSAFELLDGQRKAFAECRAAVKEVLQSSSVDVPPKRVIVVNGPPGSGKSVVAARLWASLVTDQNLSEGDVVFTTTSMSQNSNWSHLFKRSSGVGAASGVVRKATGYTPITTQRLGQLRRHRGQDFLSDASEWRQHIETLRALGEPFREGARDNQNLVSIVDEAHALIDPSDDAGSGQFGFVPALGPQAYHIIRSSLISIFLLDPEQGFRQRENTSIDDIAAWSHELGAGEPVVVSLEGAQFRCAGSVEYVAWVQSLLEGRGDDQVKQFARRWRSPELQARMDVRIFSDPEGLEGLLREHQAQGASVRLLSTFSRPWRSMTASRPHDLAPSEQDFCEKYTVGGDLRTWHRPWNHIPGGGSNYTWFVAGPPGSFIADDPLCEVGCTYAVRGFDFDYVGILWLDDLKWRDDRWLVDPAAVKETGISDLIAGAKRENSGKQRGSVSQARLSACVRKAYRILMTRALKGVYLWIPDDETRAHVASVMLP